MLFVGCLWAAGVLLGVAGVCGVAVDPWYRHTIAHNPPSPTHSHTPHPMPMGPGSYGMHAQNICWATCPSATRHSKCHKIIVACVFVSFEPMMMLLFIYKDLYRLALYEVIKVLDVA